MATFEVDLPPTPQSEDESMAMVDDEDLLIALDMVEEYEQRNADAQNTIGEQEDITETGDGPEVTIENVADDTVHRFPQMNEDDLEGLVADATSKHTNKMTRWGVNVLKRRFLIINANLDPTPCTTQI